MACPKGTPRDSAKSVLRPRQAAFVREYVGAGCKNAKQAAIRAGYAAGASAEVTASRLLRNPLIIAEIEKAQGRISRRHEIPIDRVVRELATIAFVDPKIFFDSKGALLPMHRMPKRGRQAIKTVLFREGTPSGLRLRNKIDALKLLAKLLGFFDQPLDQDGRLSIEEARRRAGL